MATVVSDADFETKCKELKEKHKDGIIVGLKDFGGIIARKEIDVLLVEEPKMFNLLILALRELKKAPHNDIMGWFQIATWNGVPGKKPTPTEAGPNLDGYCPHGLRTFGAWHRPYLVMLEQALFIQMVEIAKNYKKDDVRKSYLEAAQRFRLPYWDYYRPRGGRVVFPGIIAGEAKLTTYDYDYSVPRIFTEERLMVRTVPDNKLALTKNPFSNFCFNETNGDLRSNEWTFMDKKVAGTLLNHQHTSRHPYSLEKNPQDVIWDNPQRLNTVLNEMRMDSNRFVLDMLSGSPLWSVYDEFITAGENEPVKPLQENSESDSSPLAKLSDPIKDKMNAFKGSIEGVHNLYHVLLGGNPGPVGHMGRVPTAAFDPIFWFHHNQIERIISLWQSINGKMAEGWFRDEEQAKSNLIPFIKDIKNDETRDVRHNVYWKPDDLKEITETFGYTYDDIKDTPQNTVEGIEETYRWSVPKERSGAFGKIPDKMKPLDLSKLELFKVPGPQPAQLLSEDLILQDSSFMKEVFSNLEDESGTASSSPVTEIWDWQIGDRVKRLALNGSFAIMYYVKDKNEHGEDLYNTDQAGPSLAGITYIFASSKEVCSNCAKHDEHDRVVQNAVSITSQLLDYVRVGQIKSLHPDQVVPFLKERLRWRIVDADGYFIDPRETDVGLKLSVLSYKSDLAGAIQDVLVHDDIIKHILEKAGKSPTIPIPLPIPQPQIDLWAEIEV